MHPSALSACPIILDIQSFKRSWSMVFFLFGAHQVMPRGVRCGAFSKLLEIWIWSCLMWCIWSERNARNLKDVKNSFSIWSFYSLNLYLSKWMLLLFSILPICLRCVTVILVVLNFGVPVYLDYAPFEFNHWNIYS